MSDIEYFNVRTIIHIPSHNLCYLSIAGDLVDLTALANTDWPNIRTLILTNHSPTRPRLPLAVIVSRMPRLETLTALFSVAVEYTSPFIFCPKSKEPLQLCSILPQLKALTLSNVFPEDHIFNQLPPGLMKMILALRDPVDPSCEYDEF